MVDTLAPKRIFTQRELDQKLTPVTEQVLRTRPRARLLDTVPQIKTEPSLIDRQTEEAMQDSKKPSKEIITEEQAQTAKSSQETLQEKQTGMKVDTEAQRGQGLVMRPMEYAAKGYDDKEVSGPILVGEQGPEMIVPTGNGKISILPNSIVQGMMSKPMKKAQQGADDVMIGRLGNPPKRPEPADMAQDTLPSGFFDRPEFPKLEPIRPKMDTVIYDSGLENEFRFLNVVGKGLGKTDKVARSGQVSDALDKKFDNDIFPQIEGKDLPNIPKNINKDDFSSSLRDAYKHSYGSGMFSLIGGKEMSKQVAQNSQEYNQIFLPVIGTSRKGDNPAERDEVLMDINNNRVGFNIANEVRKELGYEDNERITGKNLEKAEKLFAEKHTQMYLNTVQSKSTGDSAFFDYGDTSDTKNYKKTLNSIIKDENPRDLIIKFGPEKIKAERKKLAIES
jgi:hypothetical protein